MQNTQKLIFYRAQCQHPAELTDDVLIFAYLDRVEQTDGSNLSFRYHDLTENAVRRINQVNYPNPADTSILLMRLSYQRHNTVIQSYTKITTKLYFNEHASITQIDRERGYPFTMLNPVDSCFYRYNEKGQLASMTSAGQGKQYFQYEEPSGLLMKHQKANGQITEYVYDQTSPRHNLIAQIHTVNGQAQVTRKVYDQALSRNRGLFLRFEISPEGRVTEYRYEYFGYHQYTRIYLEARFPIEHYPKNGVPTLAEMTSWLAQQNLQKISLTESQIYGVRRRLTYYYGTINAQGEGVKDDKASLVNTHYTAFGDLCFHSEYRKTSDENSLDTYRDYDSLRRLLSEKNAALEMTTYQYDSRHMQITRPNNRKEITEWDARGWVAKEQQTISFNNQWVTRETTYHRSILDCCTEKCTTADGEFSYRFFDKQNRLGFVVHPSGRLTEYRYDAQKRSKMTIGYAKKLDIKKLAAMAEQNDEPIIDDLSELIQQMDIIDPQHDHIRYEFYDHSDRLSIQVDAENYYRQTLYNERDAVIAQINYATPIKPEQLAALLKGESIALSADPQCDRIERTFYDADQYRIGTQDAAGYVIEYKYNGAGWLTEIIRYAHPQIISITTQNFDKIRPVASAEDAHHYFFYNPRGWVVLSVDAEGYVTTKDYLLNGLVSRETRYANPVDATWYKNTQCVPALPEGSVDDKTTDYEYDVLNREIERHRSDGKVTFTRYDNMGEVIAKGEQDATRLEINGDTYRANEMRFDGWGQIIAKASAQNSELLARIEADNTLKPEEKQQRKEKIWNEQTRRHVYDASGLKLSTAVRATPEASDQLTYFYYNTERQLIVSLHVVADKQTQIREYTRDTFNNIVKTRDYSQVKAVLADKWNEPLTGGFMSDALRHALDALQEDQDVVTQTFYNKRDEVITRIDPEGFETQHIPNAFSEGIQTLLPVGSKQPTLMIQRQFDARGLEISTQRQADALSIKIKRDYSNPYGKLTHLRDELKGDYQHGYDRKGRLIWTQNPLQQQRRQISYDAWDQPTQTSTALGQTTHYHYHLNKRYEVIIDPLGHQRIIIRNIFAEKIKEIDAHLHTQTWQHTPCGQISHYTDALGRGYSAVYNLLGWLTEKQILSGIKTQFIYDALGRVITTIHDAEGIKRQTHAHYNLLGHCVKTIDAKGIVQENKYDRRGLVIKEWFDAEKNGLNLITTRTYNGQKKLVRETQGDVNESDCYTRQLDYDGLNRHDKTTVDPLTETRKDALNIQTQHHKNGQDSLLAEIDANGQITRFILDAAGRRCFQINALGGVTEWKYNAVDQIILERHYQQPINDVLQIQDDTTPEQLRAMLKPDAEDTRTYYFYDANGKQRFVVCCDGQQGYVNEKRYDALQQEIQTIQYATGIALDNIEKRTTEQLAKQVTKIENATSDRHHYFLRDEVGQLRFSIDPQHYVREQRFDKQGRVISQIRYANPVEDPSQFVKLPIADVLSHLKKDECQDRYQFFFFDRFGQPRYTVKSEGQVIRYQHDAKGNLIEAVQFNQRLKVPQEYAWLLTQLQFLKPDATQDRITKKEYDAANRLIKHTDAVGAVETYQYDALGNRTTYTDRQQSMWKTMFDRAKRPMIERTPPVTMTEVSQDASGFLVASDSTVVLEKHKTYDQVGNLVRMMTAANTQEPRVFEAEYNGLNQWHRTHVPSIAVDNGTHLKPDDWRYRPESKQTLTTTRTVNAKGLKVAEQDAAGHWQFWVYDQQHRLVYQVNAVGVTTKKERDAFGQSRRKIINATPCTLDLSVYGQTGIPKSVLDDYYRTRHTDADQITDYQYDRCGRMILQRQGPVYCYTQHFKNKAGGGLSQEKAEIKKTYNAWGEQIAQSEKIDALRHKEHVYWLDRNGTPVAELDRIDVENQTPQYRCQRFENDHFNQRMKQIAYAKTLNRPLDASLPFEELKQALDKIASPTDRQEQFYYDKANRLIKKVRVQAIRQTLQVTDGLPTFTDTSPHDLSVSYQYNANGQMIAKTLEDGSVEWHYYDARGCKLAQTEVVRDNAGYSNVIIPLTYYGHNAHGQIVLTTRFQHGAKPVQAGSIPEPVAVDSADQHEKRIYDARGKLQWKQSNQQRPQGLTYTAHGKLARQWWTLTNWQQKEGNQYETKIHLDEKFFYYDAHQRVVRVDIRRDTKTVETNSVVYDAFDHAIAEGETAENGFIYRRFDRLGRLWSSNAEKGIPTITLYDLTGQSILRLQSPSKDLSVISYREIPNLLEWDINDLERTENQRDLAGRIMTRSLPANYQVDTSQPEIIPLSILASHRYPHFGPIQSLSWPIPQEKNAVAEFSLWPKDFPEQKQTLPLATQEGRCGVDVSTWATDVYDYQVDYTFTDPITHEKKQVYISSGTVQFDTGNTTSSHHLVPLTDAQQTSLVRLTGNTTGLSAVELWDEFGKRETLELQIDPITHTYSVDLSHHSSGVYQLKPLTQDKKPHDLSLPFTLYTHKPAHKPLSRELATGLQCRFLDNHVELDWYLPPFLQSQVVKLTCHYLDRKYQSQFHSVEIAPDQKRTPYTDKKGNTIQSNVDFRVPILAIEKLSFAVQWPMSNTPPATTHLHAHWLMLATENSESSDEEEWEMVPPHSSAFLDAAPKEWIPLYRNETPLAPAFDPEQITELHCANKNLLLIHPLPDITPDQQPPVLDYLDVSLDRLRVWRQFDTVNTMTDGLVIDVTPFSAGVYPFRCQESTGNLVIRWEGHVFPTQSMNPPDRQHLVQPARRYRYDVWNNPLTETDTLGHTTHFVYNDADQRIQKQEPQVNVVDEHGETHAMNPITQWGYHSRGWQIAKRDANGNTRAFVLDAAGHRIQEIASDGTTRNTQVYDAFNRVIEAHDARGEVTHYFYDHENNLLAFQKPSGRRRSYTYNELKQRTSDTDPATNTRRYNFDALGNLIERYEPLGQWSRMVYGRNHQLVNVENPDNSRLTWQRDALGRALNHTDLSGTTTHYTYDYKGQLIESRSENGKHGDYLKLQSVIKDGGFFAYALVEQPNMEQQLHYQYVSGQVTAIIDKATDKKTVYRYDTEGRRIAVNVRSQTGEVLRETVSEIDALGREILTRDHQAVFTTAYDAVSNRRFLKGVIQSSEIELADEVWWKYDSDDRVLIEGVLEDGEIRISANKGREFTYKEDRRVTESELLPDKKVTWTFGYDRDGGLIGSRSNTGKWTEREFDPAGRQICYRAVTNYLWSSKEEERTYNANSWLVQTVQRKAGEGGEYNIRTDYQSLTAMGFPTQQTIDYQDRNRNVDHLDYTYVGWETWRVAVVGGYRSNRHGRSGYSLVKTYRGPNGEPCAVVGGVDPEGENKYFIATPDGLILHRVHLNSFVAGYFYSPVETYYFYRVNGQYLASYKKEYHRAFDLALNFIRPQGEAGKEIGVASTKDWGRVPEIYTCGAGESYESVTRNLYGDGSLGSYIDAANGGVSLVAGQTIVIPQLISVHNKAGMSRPYYQFLQIIQGSLTPHLDTPQPPHDNFLSFLIKAIVAVVICIVVPEIAPELLASLTATLGSTGVLVLGAGLVDAAGQGLCIGLGIQDQFSLTELATTMITTGFGAQLGAFPVDADAAQLTEFIVKAGAINVSEQLTEMAIGIRQQFDLAGVALAMGSAGLNSKIKLDNPLERRLAADVGVAAMTGVVRGRFDMENLAMQMMTDTAGYLAQHQSQSVSEDYQASQKASRGGNALSPWESELINDAQFTANTPLPSVTLDVNDEVLAQHIGAEVSRFQHVDPPRNPSGFWQRVEQRYESVFEGYESVLEQRAFIAEGRAAANSEVIRESLGNATANQQNDLDLGYTESVAQYGSGWIGISEIPATKTIRLGIQATRFLAENKWGFFGRNEAESTASSPNILQDFLKNAKLTPVEKDYPNPTDHYNIEIHTANPARPGKFTPQENVHIVVDDKLQIVDVFLKNKVRIIFAAERNNLGM
ncbi:hypothetical protein BEV13_06920 [Rickettsiella grylli]|uniref:RHS repeat protein n=1 Tax=Rickettsiella grylli TaxID=59196 RepID=UPI0008FD7E57|nr:RHS repeat protein [Rickettsiella grylli]OIZ98243.1 hypothetical protein BEV13_06920 [Rickettsiella grylli]